MNVRMGRSMAVVAGILMLGSSVLWRPVTSQDLTSAKALTGEKASGETASGENDAGSSTSASADNPVEVGLVKWGRDLDAALQQSDRLGKPVLVLFQEVPGCEGCQKFGREVLSHPLLVEAIEDEFVPVVVYNNRSTGSDAQLLRRLEEPAWNYQVIRFLNSDGDDIIPRQEGVWSTAAVASRMIQTLEKSGHSVPNYLRTVAAIGAKNDWSQVAFAMHCFWTGEYRLGKINGVIATEAGWLDGREVTLVRFDENQVSLERLAQQAASVQCADRIYTTDGQSYAGLRSGKLDRGYRAASVSDQKKQISKLPVIGRIPGINEMQKTKINSLAPVDMRSALRWLSPRQREFFFASIRR